VNAAAMSSAGDLADVVQFVDDPCDQFVNKSDDDRASGEGIARPIHAPCADPDALTRS